MNSLSSKPFAKKTFYIDLKGFLGEKKLIKDLELLGAKQEVFLSKTVSFVVSNRISLQEAGSPSTPLSSIKSISPYFFKDSSLDNKDSPASNSPIFEQKHHNEPLVPLSRGMSVLQKAREKCQGNNNKFVLDICKQWNIKVYPVQKVLTWIEKYKTKYFKHGGTKLKQELTSENVTKLYSPCIKVEDKQRKYKPRYKAFDSWVDSIDPVLLQNANKLALNFKQFGNIDCSTRPPLKEIFRQPPSRNVSLKSACLTQAMECSGTGRTSSKAGGYSSSKVTALNSFSNSVLVGGPNGKHTDKGSRNLKTKKEKHTKKRRTKALYCEICGVHYNDGEAHYEKNPHARFLNNSANYKVVEKEVDALPTVNDFLKSILAQNETSDKASETVENTGNLNEEAIDKCLKSNEKDSCLTEEYILNEKDYISASCSSGGTPLPFLETEEQGVERKDVNLTSVVNSQIVENKYDTLGSILNPPLLLPECNNVPLDLVNNSVHVIATQNGDENAYNGLVLNCKLAEGESGVDLHGNCLEGPQKENGFENNPASLAPDFSSNFKGNEINVSCLEETSSILPQSVINWNGPIVEQPLDLSNYSMNNENVVINEKLMLANSYLGDNGKDFNMMNGNSACVTGNPSLNSLQVNATVNEKSEDDSFDSDPNLAGFDAVINNCLEEVTKSLVNDTSTTEEDGPTSEFKFPDPMTQNNKLIITSSESVPQAESFKNHLVENLIVNQQPNGESIEHLNAECDVAICVSVNQTQPDFSQFGVEITALFPLEPPVASKEETENTVCCNNQDENILCIKDVSEKLLCQPLNSGEDAERFDAMGLSNLVKCIQAKVSPELLHSDDAYLVLDEADSSFNSVKDRNHAVDTNICNDKLSNEANTLESLNKAARIPNDNKAELVNLEHNVYNSAESPVIDTIEKDDKFFETKCNLNNSLENNVTSRNGIDLNEAAHSVTDVVCKIQEAKNKVVPYTEEFSCGIKENIGISEPSSGCFKKLSEKETEIPVQEEMELSCETIGDTEDSQCITKSASISKVYAFEGKDEIDKIEDTPNEMSKNENFSISADCVEYFCQTKECALTDWNKLKCSVKRASESEEPTCKKMKISLNDRKMGEKLLNAFNNEYSILNDAVRYEDCENSAQSEIADSPEPCVLKAQISPKCDGSNVCCANDSLNSSSSCETSLTSSDESNGSLLASILPCTSTEDTGKPAHIVYLSTPTPLKQGNI